MTDREGQVGAVQGVEMELMDSLAYQSLDLADRERRGDHAPGVRILLEPLEARAQPVRHERTATLREAQHLRHARDRQDAGDEAGRDPGGGAAVAEAQEHRSVEEELRDGARRTGLE